MSEFVRYFYFSLEYPCYILYVYVSRSQAFYKFYLYTKNTCVFKMLKGRRFIEADFTKNLQHMYIFCIKVSITREDSCVGDTRVILSPSQIIPKIARHSKISLN